MAHQRNLSPKLLEALFDETTSELVLATLKIENPNFAETIYIVRDTQQHTIDGNLYLALMFDIQLPSEDEETIGRLILSIDNIDRRLIQELDNLSGKTTVTLQFRLLSDLSHVELEYSGSWACTSFDVELVQVEVNVIPVVTSRTWPPRRYRAVDGFNAI